MAQDTTPALVIYTGQLVDGVWRTRFEVPFDKGSFGEIKVAFVRRGLTNYEYNPGSYDVYGYLYAWNGGVYTKTAQPTTDTPLYDKDGEPTGDTWEEGMYREPKNDIFTNAYIEWTGDSITSDDIICISRETEYEQPYVYPNNQKHIERALDNLSRQVQELQKKTQNALTVDPSWMPEDDGGIEDPNKMDPIAWLQTIVRSKGNTLRELRIDGDYVEYTTDDPDSETKTWNVLAGVKTGNAGVVSHIREVKYTDENNVDHWHLQYSVDGGETWKNAGTGAEATWGAILGPIENQTDLFNTFVQKSGDTMTKRLRFVREDGSAAGAIDSAPGKGVQFGAPDDDGVWSTIGGFVRNGCFPYSNFQQNLGGTGSSWKTTYTRFLNNGFDLLVPAKSGTLATRADVDEAANSGASLTDKGVWYAKMYAATVAPSTEDGTNYADFSQTDIGGNPVIVLYERQNGAWVEADIIVPPASYNGFVIVTSKIWDIPEQTGQQGGQVLWNHTAQTFTPYPKIVSFEDVSLTGNSTVQMSVTPTSDAIISKQYLENYVANMIAGLDVPALFDFKWKDCTFMRAGWVSSSAGWISKDTAPLAYQHLLDEWNETGDVPSSDTIAGITVYYRLAEDGHKICTASQESAVSAIYNATGVAWYYIIDTENEQFRLPQTKYAFVGYRDSVGGYVEESLPNHTHTYRRPSTNSNRGSGSHGTAGNGLVTETSSGASSGVYQDNAPVQQRATQMNLYFYVGVPA